MYGNVLSDGGIRKLVATNQLIIDTFDENRLQLAFYRLSAAAVLTPRAKSGYDQVHEFEDDAIFKFKANESYVFEIDELVVLPAGTFAEFVPVSELPTRGFTFTSGRLQPGYGHLRKGRQKMLVLVTNTLDRENVYDAKWGIAHMKITSVIALEVLNDGVPKKDEKRLVLRDPRHWDDDEAADDGPRYPV